MNWNRFAAVQDEFVGIHMDNSEARAQGLPDAIGMGNLQHSYFHNVLREWIGPGGRILTVSIQHRRYNLKDDVLTTRGRITAIDGDTVSLDLWVENKEGRSISTGQASVELAPDF
jgi:hypothetical protein